MLLMWHGFLIKGNLFHSDKKFQLMPCRTSIYSHYFPWISFTSITLESSPITLATGRKNPWEPGTFSCSHSKAWVSVLRSQTGKWQTPTITRSWASERNCALWEAQPWWKVTVCRGHQSSPSPMTVPPPAFDDVCCTPAELESGSATMNFGVFTTCLLCH